MALNLTGAATLADVPPMLRPKAPVAAPKQVPSGVDFAAMFAEGARRAAEQAEAERQEAQRKRQRRAAMLLLID